MPDDIPSAEALKARLIRAKLATAEPGPVAGQAERDRGIAHPPEQEGVFGAFGRGFQEGYGGGASFEPGKLAIYQPFREIGDIVSGAARGTQEALASTGRLGRDIAAMPEAFAGSPGALAVPQMARKIPSLGSSSAEKEISDLYSRAVKPSVSGKTTASQIDKYNAQARTAIDLINENKPNLVFTDAAGNVTRGKSPQSLDEFGDAIEQTKQGIFNQYDAMARAAGAAGVEVPLSPTETALKDVANDRVTQLMHPEVAQYAEGRAKAFGAAAKLSPGEAQRAVAMLNSSLKAYYRNPTYDNTGRAYVDSMVANQLREGLDDTISSISGEGYQEFKKQYGALKAIEKDVNNRAQVVARQEKGGGILGRIADVGSAEEVIRGLLTLNPVAVARGGALKGWAEFMKWRRNPNRAVTKLFEEAEKAKEPSDRMISLSPIAPQLGLLAAQQPVGLLYGEQGR